MVRPDQLIRELLASGGATNATGDYSLAPETFEWEVPAGRIFFAEEFTVIYSFTGSTDISDYGPISGGLTNGITFQIVTAQGVATPLSSINPITNNLGITYMGTEEAAETGTGNTQGFIMGRVFFARLVGSSDNLSGAGLMMSQGAKVQAILNDSFTSLAGHYFEISGRMENA